MNNNTKSDRRRILREIIEATGGGDQRHLLNELKTPVTWEFKTADALSVMLHDKKVRQENFLFVLIDDIGRVFNPGNWTCRISESDLIETLQQRGGT